MSGPWNINKTIRSLLDDEVVFHVEVNSHGTGQSWRVRAPRAKGVTEIQFGIDDAVTEAIDQRDAFDRAILFGRGWSAETASLFDEEGVDGWTWSHPDVMQDYDFIGDWKEPAPIEMSLIEAEEKRLKDADAPKPPRAPVSSPAGTTEEDLIAGLQAAYELPKGKRWWPELVEDRKAIRRLQNSPQLLGAIVAALRPATPGEDR